ncbi:hypothetical protein QJS10_CPA03g01113 [Acorus calamus]|uniref:Uncharacterized protein n=1 Tax=Acorus calamus TaxID=4465 RepID=A0AAV9F5Q5_ACOCL|nr:hypothetical protein QJS10_CPA03g01113 [Acorus calamus]
MIDTFTLSNRRPLSGTADRLAAICMSKECNKIHNGGGRQTQRRAIGGAQTEKKKNCDADDGANEDNNA